MSEMYCYMSQLICTCSTVVMLPQHIFTDGKLSYHVLTPAYQDTAHALISRAFCSLPLTKSLDGTPYASGYMEWLEFHHYWMDHTASNGMSVMAMDKDNCRMVGVLTLKDLAYTIPEFKLKYTDDSLGLTALGCLAGKPGLRALVMEISSGLILSKLYLKSSYIHH